MEIGAEEFIGRVLKNLDENGEIVTVRVHAGYESASVTDLISDVMEEVAQEVILGAKWSEIDEWLDMTGDVEWLEPGHGELELPADFLRLMEFRMSDWKKTITSPASMDSELYALRFNPCKGRRSIRKAPMAVISGGVGGKRIEFTGSSDPGAYLERAGYLPHPLSADGEQLWIPRSLMGRVVEAVAARVRRITE